MSRAEDFSDNFLFKAGPLDEGYNRIIARGEKSLKYLEFGILYLESGEWTGKTGDCEQALDIHRGVVFVSADGVSCSRLGGRMSVLYGPPSAVYLPPGTAYTLKVLEGPVEIEVFSALAAGYKEKPVIVPPRDRRDLPIIGGNVDAARLIVAETLIQPGSWSAPHKHDAFNPPNEMPMEEICLFRVDPPHGFGVIRIYTGPNDPGPMDEIYVIEDGDTAVIPRGTHVIGAAPGSSVHVTCAMAGEIRRP